MLSVVASFIIILKKYVSLFLVFHGIEKPCAQDRIDYCWKILNGKEGQQQIGNMVGKYLMKMTRNTITIQKTKDKFSEA